MQSLTEQRSRVPKILKYLKEEKFQKEMTNSIILTVHNAYLSLFEAGLIENYSGDLLQAVQIANTISNESPYWKMRSAMVMNAIQTLVESGEINPAVLYEEADVIMIESQERTGEVFRERMENVTEKITLVSETVEPIADAYLKYLKIVGAVVLVGGGLYGYTLYTVNKKF